MTVVLLAAAVVFVAGGIVYFTKTAADLPSFFPGHKVGSTRHHIKHGLAMIAVAVVALIGAWLTTGAEPQPAKG